MPGERGIHPISADPGRLQVDVAKQAAKYARARSRACILVGYARSLAHFPRHDLPTQPILIVGRNCLVTPHHSQWPQRPHPT